MVQYSTDRNTFLNNNDTIFEVILSGGTVSSYLPKGNLNTGADAFGRVRTSEPHTIFDSSFRYVDNTTKWSQKLSGGATAQFNASQGLMDLSVTTANGSHVIRETNRAFGYQPGKSLLILTTFTFNVAKQNLRQRVGYYGKFNGVYLEQDNFTPYIVERSSVGGSIANNRIAQSDWNVDRLDGTGLSGLTLDLSKSQIFWMDIEWLGVGSVRCGFVINGQLVVCHILHHANHITGTYITTASLPVRYEIENTGATDSSSTMKQICASILSEGGYDQHNITRSASTAITGKDLPSPNTPMVSLRLRPGRTDGVVYPATIDFYGLQASGYKYSIYRRVASLTNANWQLTDSASSVQYDISATAMSGGELIKEGIFRGQSTTASFVFSNVFNSSVALTRGIVDADSAGNIMTIAITPTTNNDDAVVSLTWQENTV